MITISLVSFLVGAALGQRFEVIVLVPAIVIFSGLAIVTGGADGQPAWAIVLMVATIATCLQIGYFGGVYIRHALRTKHRKLAPYLESDRAASGDLVNRLPNAFRQGP